MPPQTPTVLSIAMARRMVATFQREGMPGMTLTLAPKPLVNRCQCGRQISENKAQCLASIRRRSITNTTA